MDVTQAIRERRSIRSFTDDKIDKKQVEQILEAGMWAPSGLNNQPWKFKLVEEGEKDKLAVCTKYGHIIKSAPACICIFLDSGESYDHVKDVQACGAAIQNMLLAIHELGLGGVWLGEILNQKDQVNKMLGIDKRLELMAVIAFGQPSEKPGKANRKNMDDVRI